MAGEAQNNIWPLPKFHFSVSLGDDKAVKFSEVTGLESETKTIEYRHGDSAVFAPLKMPGLASVGNVTMRKGIFATDHKFWDWYNEIKMNTIKRRTVIVNLLDESGAPKMVWTLNNAFPVKLSGTDLKSDANEVAVETIEMAFETLTVSAP